MTASGVEESTAELPNFIVRAAMDAMTYFHESMGVQWWGAIALVTVRHRSRLNIRQLELFLTHTLRLAFAS